MLAKGSSNHQAVLATTTTGLDPGKAVQLAKSGRTVHILERHFWEHRMASGRLGIICEKIIEAGWLAAVVVTPLFFSGYTSTVMDADKLALLRSIAAIMVVAWLVKLIDEHRSPCAGSKMTWRSPMVIPILLLVGVSLLATLTSIAPRASLFGSYQRAQGIHTLISFVVVFAMLLSTLRTRQQFDRLIVTIILTSLPIALYGIMQKFGFDPLSWGIIFDGRSGSTVGNPIFLGGYLIMVFALTLGKIAASVRAIFAARQAGTRLPTEVVLTITYSLVALAQSIAILVTESRGPFLGWIAGIILFILLMALVWGKRWLMFGGVGIGTAGVVFLLVLNLPNTPLAPLLSLPGLSRLANLTNSTGEFRLFTWENATRLALPRTPIQFPDGTSDVLYAIRPLVGYGPETMALVYSQVSPASPFTLSLGTDRSHNATWDAWVNTGVMGLIGYQLLFLCLFLYGFGWLNLIRTTSERKWFAGLWIGLGSAGALLVIVLGQPLYLGVALPAGNMTAMVVYLLVFASRTGTRPQPKTLQRSDQVLLAALLAGLFAHYVESQFGIDVPPTQVIFWVFAGMLVVLGTVQLDAVTEPKRSPSNPKTRPVQLPSWMGGALSYALILTTIFSTLIFEFVRYEKGVSDPLTVLWRGLTFDPVQNSNTYAILGLMLSVWAVGVAITSAETARIQAPNLPNSRGKGLITFAALPVCLTAIFAAGLAIQLGALPYIQTPAKEVSDVIGLAGQVIGIVDYYAASLAVLSLIMVAAFVYESKASVGAWLANRWTLIALVALVPATLLWINAVNLNPIRADAIYRLGKLFDDQSDWNAGIALYKGAIALAPTNDVYDMSLARAFQQKSVFASTTAASRFSDRTTAAEILTQSDQSATNLNRLDLLYASQKMLLRARDLNPLYPDHTTNLARFYHPELPIDSAAKTQLVELANQYYSEAQRLNPNSVLLWNERADFDLTFRNDPDSAIDKLNTSITRDAQLAQTYLYLGKAYAAKSDPGQALEAYKKALALDPKSVEAESKLAFLYYQKGQIDESIQAYLNYIKLAPGAQNIWEAHKNLALIYRQTGNLAGAIHEAQVAAGLAPNEYTAQLNDLVSQLQRQ